MPTNNELDVIVPDNNISYEDKMDAFLVAKGVEGCQAYDADTKGFNVQLQDKARRGFNLYMCQDLATTTLSEAAVLEASTVKVTSATGAVAGDCIVIRENCNIFQSIITNVTGTTITFASPIDHAFTTAASVCFGEWNFATANGSTTPVTFKICPPIGCDFYICAITITISDGTAGDISKFGGITKLAKGIVIRRVDGNVTTFGLISNNGGFKQYGYEVEYNDRAGAGGLYSVEVFKDIRKVNGSPVVLYGATADELQILVQDNLTGLTEMTCVLHGYIVEE